MICSSTTHPCMLLPLPVTEERVPHRSNSIVQLNMLDFPTLIVLMVLGALALAWWNAARAANEQAVHLGRAACERANVIWVDHTVHASGLRLYRRANGYLGLERRFRFEYSHTGQDRHLGQLILRGTQLVSLIGPSVPEYPADTV